LSAEFIIVID